MGVRIVLEGLQEVLDNLTKVEEKAPENLEKQVAHLAKDTQEEWKQNTPRRTGQTQDAEQTPVDGLKFTMNNCVKWYDWLNDGHMTPRGWHTKHGYRPAKRRSHVEGREMTQKALDYVERNATQTLSKFLDNV